MKIAGKNTEKEWAALKARLQLKPTQRLWDSAFRHFYRKRIDTRYLHPIASIQDTRIGEGFAMVTLFCCLVEFLESCEQGKNFRLTRNKKDEDALLPTEYNQRQAAWYFKQFLRTRKPISTR